ncbi:hypothetical protein FDP41_004098 [Naegleria fowleri]|uniref:GPN-loop GTPase 2 n=1 Tax=Naegleria fowleri TaxID=5763 RepID=A0A6A5BG31_NAEFO|nr:uncharacterized protein FDP41_004098 [Naegleria fowleri]KAF0976803.1 hypothetical protein FDP41_004098 [Naegleria fowleri]
MPFGQVVVGPPGSGKSTYCNGMQQFMRGIGRKVVVVNMDPANEGYTYECGVDIQDLICVQPVMEELKLGPNGALIYCMEYLKEHLEDWLKVQLKPYIVDDSYYVIFDMPGQIELYTHYNVVKDICDVLVNKWHFRLCAVNLVDAHHCTDASKYISVLMVSLSIMIRLELPHVNILSKIDLIEQYGKLAFDIDFYTDVQDLSYLVQSIGRKPESHIDGEANSNPIESDEDENDDDEKHDMQDEESFESKIAKRKRKYKTRFRKLNQLMADVIQDYSLVSFCTLNIQDKESVLNVLKTVDKASGYVFGACEQDNTSILDVASSNLKWAYEANDDVRTKYLKEHNDE